MVKMRSIRFSQQFDQKIALSLEKELIFEFCARMLSHVKQSYSFIWNYKVLNIGEMYYLPRKEHKIDH